MGLGLILAISLILYALKQNINLFYTPSELLSNQKYWKNVVRIGGLVVKNTVHKNKQNLVVLFDVTDLKETITVQYEGILPDLFQEGQGIIAKGRYDQTQKMFLAQEVLAKHDENYMPPEVAKKINVM